MKYIIPITLLTLAACQPNVSQSPRAIAPETPTEEPNEEPNEAPLTTPGAPTPPAPPEPASRDFDRTALFEREVRPVWARGKMGTTTRVAMRLRVVKDDSAIFQVSAKRIHVGGNPRDRTADAPIITRFARTFHGTLSQTTLTLTHARDDLDTTTPGKQLAAPLTITCAEREDGVLDCPIEGGAREALDSNLLTSALGAPVIFPSFAPGKPWLMTTAFFRGQIDPHLYHTIDAKERAQFLDVLEFPEHNSAARLE